MEEITTLASTLVLPLTISVVPVLYVVNVAKDRPRPLREAVDAAPAHVARWVLWLALALTVVYSVLYTLDRLGAWALAALFFSPFVGVALALPVVKMWKKLRRGAAGPEPPSTPGTTTNEEIALAVDEHGDGVSAE